MTADQRVTAAREYLAVVHPTSLEPLDRADTGSMMLIAARVGRTRLIDNAVLP